MPAFKRFGPGDQLDNVLLMEPSYNLASGSSGWRGAPDGSASVSLYGGARRSPAHVVTQIEYQSIAPNAGQTGNPTRGTPLTSSIHYVWMTDEELSLTQRTSERWGREHWKTLQRLYQDYQSVDADYVTSSYDHYCLYFHGGSTNVVAENLSPDDVNNSIGLTGSFCIESFIKPFTTSSLTTDFTVNSIGSNFWFGITGSTGLLALSSSRETVTSSFGPTADRWSHVAVSFDSTTLTGAFYINNIFAGGFTLPAAMQRTQSATQRYTVGNQTEYNGGSEASGVTGSVRRSFHGFIGETRIWKSSRTAAQISGTSGGRLTGSLLAQTSTTMWFNEGPLVNCNFYPAPGSGGLDVGRIANGYSTDMTWRMNGFTRLGPTWHPNDNPRFVVPKQFAPVLTSWSGMSTNGAVAERSADVSRMVVIDVPAGFYGRQISPGSVRLECRAWSDPSYGLIRVLVDDGRGNLYLSGSACSSSIDQQESYTGVGWNKVGNVFYGEGLITIREPSLLDFGRTDGLSAHPNDTFQLSFRGHSRIPVKTLMCRIDRGEFNASTNPTFYDVDDDGTRTRRHESGSIRATTVGLYNSDRELVGVARLAEPVRIRPRDRINIRLRMDF